MISADRKNVSQTAKRAKREAADELAKYGITRVPNDYYHYKEYRYTNLADAIAQAKRASLSE